VSFCVLFVCKCVLNYCYREAIQLQLINISYHISYHINAYIRAFIHIYICTYIIRTYISIYVHAKQIKHTTNERHRRGGRTPPPDHRPATYWVHYTTSCIAQSNAPEDGQNNCPKHVELIRIINKQLLLQMCIFYYLYQWCTVKQISNNVYHLNMKYELKAQNGTLLCIVQ
jgi:hypothetical protein